jgi:hypothetical protein
MELQTSNDGCKNKCSHNPNKLINLLLTIKSVYERLAKDICQYAQQIETFQEYYHQFDLNDDTMLAVMVKRLKKISELFYITFFNHLSGTVNVNGVGEKIIKPATQEYGTTTTMRYQNICKICSDCSNCNKKKCHGKDRSFGCKDSLKVQTTINIATYDNVSIVENLDDDVLIGYTIVIGKLSYNIDNYSGLQLRKTVRVPRTDSDSDDDLPYIEVERVTQTSIDELYEFIDLQIKVLGDIEMSLATNINYIDRYIKKFSQLI